MDRCRHEGRYQSGMMSAFPSKADIRGRDGNVRFVPKGDIDALFDHLIGCDQHRLRYREFERARCAEIDDEFELDRLNHR